jgi:hypothetical protein
MLNRIRKTHRSIALLAVAAALAACSDAPTAVPVAASPASSTRIAAPASMLASVASAQGATLLACPASVTRSASATIGRRGGVVQVDGTALVVPPNAVPRPTRFTVTVPASSYMEIDVSAEGYEHYLFKRPVGITISYARCGDDALPDASLEAWWFDPATREQFGAMWGVDDRQHRRMTFITDHLSGYAVAYRQGEWSEEVER